MTFVELGSVRSHERVPPELTELGGYRLFLKLGEGGMGSVYLAEDPLLGRRVAIKILTAESGDSEPSMVEAFLHEARALACLKHDHVVTVYHAGVEANRPFLVMEYLEGESLRDRLARDGALPIRDTLRIVRQIAEGLLAAHGAGLIHCDVKPANIWLAHERAKLIDFGLACRLAADVNDPVSNRSGTPRYMAPEQINGFPPEPRSDLFSLGCVLYEMLAGRPPFGGDGVIDTILSIQLDEPPPLEELRPDVPQELVDLVRWMIEKEPTARPTSALRVVWDLHSLEASMGGSNRETIVGVRDTLRLDRRPNMPSQRMPEWGTLALVGLVSLFVALIVTGLVRVLID